MNEKNSASGKKDLRPLALFLFALCLLSAAAARRGGLFDPAGDPAPAAPLPLAWQEGALAPGLSRSAAAPPAEEKGTPPRAVPEPEARNPAKPPARLAPLLFQPISVNRADAELLTTIPGIGPVFARRIIEFRDRQGRIKAIEELDAVPGIGPAKLKILKAHLVVD